MKDINMYLVVLCTLLFSTPLFGFIKRLSPRNHLLDISKKISSSSVNTENVREQTSSLLNANSIWASGISTNVNLEDAIEEILQSTINNNSDASKYKVALFFMSSVYETTSTQYNSIKNILKSKLPTLHTIVGTTTGAVIGPLDPMNNFEPSEIEGRAALGITFISLPTTSQSNVKTLRLEPDEIKQYIQNNKDQKSSRTLFTDQSNNLNNPTDSIHLVFATEAVKPLLGDFLSAIQINEGIKSIGAVASGVTSLHVPKIFATGEDGNLEKYTSGAVVLSLPGGLQLNTVVARSCLPVGPLFRILSTGPEGEIKTIQRVPGGNYDTPSTRPSTPLPSNVFGDSTTVGDALDSPLVQLDQVLGEIPTAQSDALKRELLLGVLPSTTDLSQALSSAVAGAADGQSTGITEGFYGQKPTAFNPITGSISVPSLPLAETSDAGVGSYVQFCVRDAAAARLDAQRALRDLKGRVEAVRAGGGEVLAVLLLGSLERGNKVFRYKSWESSQVHFQLKELGLEKVPVFGMFSGGFVSTVTDSVGSSVFSPVIEADSLYTLITTATRTTSSTSPPASSNADSSEVASMAGLEDVTTAEERRRYNDEADAVIIEKRDAESSHAVRVAGMDYFVPDKLPQPKNVLESIVWDREKEMDRLREKMPMTRALTLAKLAEKKYGMKTLHESIQRVREAGGDAKHPPVILIGMRASPYAAAMPIAESDATIGGPVVSQLVTIASTLGGVGIRGGASVAAVGYHVDSASFGGTYEDLMALRAATSLPLVCDDFILYGYQLFRAKAAGADIVKILASVVSPKDIAYLMKTARALSLQTILVVSSKVQLLSVLQEVPDIEILAISSKNMRLWKVDQGKATRLLIDPEVATALHKYRQARTDAPQASTEAVSAKAVSPLLVLQEGFVSREELIEAKNNGVDGVILGEELLRKDPSKDSSWWERLSETVEEWTSAS